MGAMSFTRMDESTAEQWDVIVTETLTNQPRVAEQVLSMLGALTDITDGFAVDQLTHCLQTATRAEKDGAGTEMVVAALCHDVGKVISVPNHPRIAAEILRPYVDEDIRWVIEVHQDFQGRHYYGHLHMDPEARRQYEGDRRFSLAEQFADDWDQTSFDPDYPPVPLEHFEPLVREVFSRPQRL
jgi:predicted HD phosphohydrolase